MTISSVSGVSVTTVTLPMPCALPGAKCGRFAYGYAINDSGTVARRAEFHVVLDLYNSDGALWPQGDGVQHISWTSTPGSTELIELHGINNRGDLIGHSLFGAGRAFVNGQHIGNLPGYMASAPVVINNVVEVVGYSTGSMSADRAFAWTAAGGMRALEFHLDGSVTDATPSIPYDINDFGMAVGVIGGRGVLWDTRHGGVTELAPIFGVAVVRPRGLNNKGEIVGWLSGYEGAPSSGGLFWSPSSGVRMLDAREAMDINDSSVVLGHGYVWTAANGTLPLLLPTGGAQGAVSSGKINNRNQVPGYTYTNSYMCCSNAVRFDLQLPPPNRPPIAAVGGPYEGVEGTAISFDGSTSSDPEGGVLSYTWSFGDGEIANTTTPAVSHTYADDGAYVVTLVVTDAAGAGATASTIANVANIAPSVNLTAPASLLSGGVLTAVASFVDPGVRDMPWRYVIEWGIGPPLAGATDVQATALSFQSPQYCHAGSYTLQASVTDKNGAVGTAAVTLTVNRITVHVGVLAGAINPGARGKLPVALLSTNTFNVSQVDVSTLTLGDDEGHAIRVAVRGNGTPFTSMEDVNGDGQPDLVAHFDRQELAASGALDRPNAQLVVRARLTDGCREAEGVTAARLIMKEGKDR